MRVSLLRNQSGLLAALALLLAALQLHALLGRFTVIAPGIAVRLDEIVRVQGGRGPHDGAFLVTAVYAEPAGLLSLIYAAIDPRVDLTFQGPEGSVVSPIYQAALELSMTESEAASKAVALRAAGFRIPERRGLLVTDVDAGGPFAGKLRSGDVIVGLDGARVESRADLAALLSQRPLGDAVTLRLDRHDKTVSYVTRLAEAPSRTLATMSTSPHVLYQLPMRIDIEARDIRGSSAGLMFALEIYSQLSKRSLTHGLVIAGTGALESDGTVSVVSGVKQKVIAAQRWGADIFIIPRGNADEARPFSRGMELLPVSTFDECLRALEGGPQP